MSHMNNTSELIAQAQKIRSDLNSSYATIPMTDILSYVQCPLCLGHLVDPTTIVECMHTFCKSCITRRFSYATLNSCPVCQLDLGAWPATSLKADHTKQAILKKLFPEVEQEEEADREEFYSVNPHLRIYEGDSVVSTSRQPDTAVSPMLSFILRSGGDDLLDLHYSNAKLKPLEQHLQFFLRTKPHAKVLHMQKYLCKKLPAYLDSPHKVDVFCKRQLLDPDRTLEHYYKTIWCSESAPIFEFIPRLEMEGSVDGVLHLRPNHHSNSNNNSNSSNSHGEQDRQPMACD